VRLAALREAGDLPATTAINVEEIVRGLRPAEHRAATELFTGLVVLPIGKEAGLRAGEWRSGLTSTAAFSAAYSSSRPRSVRSPVAITERSPGSSSGSRVRKRLNTSSSPISTDEPLGTRGTGRTGHEHEGTGRVEGERPVVGGGGDGDAVTDEGARAGRPGSGADMSAHGGSRACGIATGVGRWWRWTEIRCGVG
jgi:hypothetical protein